MGGRNILVVGSGVSGLTTAILLLEAGEPVEILAREEAQQTTSRVAGAIWHPYTAAPLARVRPWALESLRFFKRLAQEPTSGVSLRSGRELFRGSASNAWWWQAAGAPEGPFGEPLPPGCRELRRGLLPVVTMNIYLGWLSNRFQALGGCFKQETLASLVSLKNRCSVAVNCSGLGALALANDPGVHPVGGQLVRVSQVGLQAFTWDQDHPLGLTYVIPHEREIILGGTALSGQTKTSPKPAVSQAILERCRSLEPSLKQARVLGSLVGLRPARAEVRLEGELVDGLPVVHNYGHGGAGVTLSWGCAKEAAALVLELLG